MPSPFEDIFGGSGPQWTWEQMQARLDAAIARERLPRDLVYALVKQESNWDPDAQGDGGRAKGWFQLHPGAATDAGIDPAYRDDIGLNIDAGTRYLRLKLDQAKGNEDQALRLYNGGGDPNYVANVRRWMQPQQGTGRVQPGLVRRVTAALSPASAAAASPQQAPSAAVWDDIFGAQQAPQAPSPPATVPQPPTARSTPEEAASYREWIRQGQPVTPTPVPAAAVSTPQEAQATVERLRTRQAEAATPESRLQRFQQLPAITALSPEERQAAIAEFQGYNEAQQQAILASEPAADLTQAVQEGPRPTPAQQLRPQGFVPTEAPIEESITAPSTMVPLLMPGAGLKTLPEAIRQGTGLVARAARPIVEGLSQTLGWGTGRTIETGQVPSAGELATEAGMNIAVGGAFEALHAGVQQRLRRSQAGRAIVAADDQSRAAQQAYEQEVAAARQAQQQGQQALYDEALIRAKEAQREFQMARARRQDLITTNQQVYDDAVAAQQRAVQEAKAVPGRYAPQTPSWVLYDKFGEAAKDAVVDLQPARAGLAEVRAARGVLPDGTARPFPAAVEQIASALEKAEGRASVQTIRNELRRLGPLTRSPNGDIRGPAKQLYGLYADALEASPVANDLLRQANATFRREMALQDVSDWLRPGHGIVRIDQQGRQTINVGTLLTRLEKQIGDDTLFARSFTPDDLQALRQDFGRLAGTPAMPRQAPRVPREVTPPGPERVRQVPEGRMPEAPAAVTPRQALGEQPAFGGPRAGTWGAILATMTAIGVPAPVTATAAAIGAVHVTQKQARWLMAHYLLTPNKRPLVQAALDSRMRLNPRTYGVMVHLLSPEEKKQYQRETR